MEGVNHILPAAAPVGAALIEQFRNRFPAVTVREGMPSKQFGQINLFIIISLNGSIKGNIGF